MLSNLFLDRLHRQNVTVQLLIFTKKNDPQLPRYIMEQLDRGVTSWAAKGGWTGDDVQVLCVCLSKYEIDTLFTPRERQPGVTSACAAQMRGKRNPAQSGNVIIVSHSFTQIN